MSDEKALLAAIWDRPHDDLPRLAYADWLEETGDPANVARAEFIRVQCERERLDEWDDGPKRDQLQQRAADLRKKHGMVWKKELPRSLHSAGFHRGFPAPKRRRFSGERFLQVSADEFAPAPLWDVSLTSVNRCFDRLLATETLSCVGTLAIELPDLPDSTLGRVANCPYLRNLARLELHYLRPSAGVVSTLLNSDSVPSLRELDIYAWQTPGAVLRAICESRKAGDLTRLRVNVNGIPAGRPPTLSAAFFPRLVSLDLSSGALDDESIRRLAEDSLPALRSLRLAWAQLTDAGVRVLADWPGGRHLRHLDLATNRLGDEALLALARSPHLTNLKELRVGREAKLFRGDSATELEARYKGVLRYA